MNGFYWIYLVMLAFLLGYEAVRSKGNKRLVYYGACAFLMLIFVAQDAGVSVDMGEYMLQYSIIPELSFGQMLIHKFEIGYVLLCWVLERLFGSQRILLLVMSVLILLPFCRSFEEETENPMIALMAFVALGMYMHALIFWRQLAAMAILTFSFRYLRQRRLMPFLLVVLLAMTFHKVAVVMLPLYPLWRVPINKRLLLLCAAAAVVLGFFGKPIIRLGIRLIYHRYEDYPLLNLGGETLLALLWTVTLLSYWLLRDRLEEPAVRLPFLMILVGAAIQPVCFAFFWWLRVVLFFRVALVPMTVHLYTELFRNKDNRAMALLKRYAPGIHKSVLSVYDTNWFRIGALLILFGVLFLWYESELDGAVYSMASIF